VIHPPFKSKGQSALYGNRCEGRRNLLAATARGQYGSGGCPECAFDFCANMQVALWAPLASTPPPAGTALASLPNAGQQSLVESEQERRPTLFIFSISRMAVITKLHTIFEPVVLTLLAGAKAYSGIDSIKVENHSVDCRARNSCNKIEQLVAMVHPGDMVVWVGERGNDLVPWSRLRLNGTVYVVFYQTEVWGSPTCAFSSPGPVDEVWDFSWHNIESCQASPNFSHAATLRYVPLGALSYGPRVAHSDPAGPLCFLGAFKNYKRRKACLAAVSSELGSAFEKHDDVWKDSAYEALLKRHDIFLNIHNYCMDGHNPVTFRVARLLNARGIVISERCHPKDEIEFDGIVTFVNTTVSWPAALAAAYNRTAAMPAHERTSLAARRHRLWTKRFAPATIFERAGLYELLRLRLLSHK